MLPRSFLEFVVHLSYRSVHQISIRPLMNQPSSPFSKQQLLPQEEKLEVLKQKGELFIGIPRESQFQERRICLTPDGVNALTAHGHKVLIEAGAGEDASFTDLQYTNAGATITRDTKKVFGCPIILKVEPPTLAEIEMINPQSTLISALQIKMQHKAFLRTSPKKELQRSPLNTSGMKKESIRRCEP